MRSLTRRFLIPALGLVGLLGMGLTPAQAVPAYGAGLVRIDANWATVKTLPNGTRVLTLDKEASGQWMGELASSLEPTVLDFDDRDVVSKWDDLGHDAGVGVDSTLTWNAVGDYQLVHLSEPQLTRRGHLRFVLEPASAMSTSELPERLEKVSVNVHRGALLQPRSLPLALPAFQVTADQSINTTIETTYYTAQVLFTSTGISIYSMTLIQQAPSQEIPPGLRCGSVVYESGRLELTLPTVNQEGNVLLDATISVSNGSPYAFSAVVATWALNQ